MNDVPGTCWSFLCPDQTSMVSRAAQNPAGSRSGWLGLYLKVFPLKISGSQTPRPLPIIPQCPPVHPPPGVKLLCVTSAPSLQLSQTWEVSPEGGEGAEQCEGVRGFCLTLWVPGQSDRK